MIDVIKIQSLINEFKNLPKNKCESTYLDICHYSGRRFEEICSRILAFYFQPNNEHGLGTLLIEAIFEEIGYDDYGYIDRNIKINLEENADGKRLDMLLFNEDWVIGIENKTGANVYNPLGNYKERIDRFGKKNSFKIVLTLYEIEGKDEKLNIDKHGFNVILYSAFLNRIKSKIGNCISGSNMKYLIFLYDFIETLERKKGDDIMNEKLDAFFSENSGCLDELLDCYQEYKNKKRKKQSQKIYEIKDIICEKPENGNWKVWDSAKNNMVILYNNDQKIRVESWFNEENNNPFASFEIILTSWARMSWDKFHSRLKEFYPDAKDEKTADNRPCLRVYTDIPGNNEVEIINKLKECYDCITKLEE